MSQNTSHAVMQQRSEAPEVISRADARASGLIRYFTGRPCLRGHICERLVSSCGCPECSRVVNNPGKRASAHAYYQNNCEAKKVAARKRWHSSPEAREKDKASRDARREEIRAYDRMRAKRDREKKRIVIERWIVNNPVRHKELAVARAHRRRARITEAGGSFSADDIQVMFASQNRKCWWCTKPIKGKFHVDHRIPIAKGGTNDRGNIVIACIPCNKTKSAKMPWEFAGRLV